MPESLVHMEGSGLVRDFAIIMAVAGVAVVVFRKLNQPPILGYLIAGVIVGPFTLPNPPVTNQESIRLLADLGLVVLLFAVGLELGWRRIRQVGMGVLLIGTVEMLVMSSLGYQVGQMMGWTAMESVFLGAALAISSSAMLIKVLADTGQLKAGVGRIVVGILVVEDFVAVILLTVLSGVGSTGSAEPQDIGLLVLKIGVFGAASLALGAIIVPRLVGVVASFRSPETLLLTSLALCFVLSLLGQMLGISAAAGAFLIGAVIGDTRQSEQITHVISPIRDMFGALFFVSIGMLVDIYLIKDYLVSALIITGVFIVGKVFGASLGTFATGRSGQMSLNVGTRMGQVGEFSLAIMKVGVESNAIGAFIYQVLVAAAAINSLVYPYLARSGDRIYRLIDRIGPPLLKGYFGNISEALQTIIAGVRLDSEFGYRVKRSAAVVLLNSMIIVVLIGVGTFAAETAPQIGNLTGLGERVVGFVVGFTTLVFCIPPAYTIWSSLRGLADVVTTHLIVRGRQWAMWVPDILGAVIRDSVMVFIVVIILLWSIPFVFQLLSLGSLAIPAPFVVLAALAFLGIRSLRRLHGYLEETFGRIFLGEEAEGAGGATPHGRSVPMSQPGATNDEHAHLAGSHRASEGISSRVQGTPPTPEAAIQSALLPITREQAESIALSTASTDHAPHCSQLRGADVQWRVKDVAESGSYFHVTLEFSSEDDARTNAGMEQIHVDGFGNVALRHVTHWHETAPRRVPSILMYAGTVLVVAVVAAILGFAVALVGLGNEDAVIADQASGVEEILPDSVEDGTSSEAGAEASQLFDAEGGQDDGFEVDVGVSELSPGAE